LAKLKFITQPQIIEEDLNFTLFITNLVHYYNELIVMYIIFHIKWTP